MGGNIGGNHDPRYVDLIVAIALLIVIGGAWTYFNGRPDVPATTTAFIVPSQTTRW